VLAQEEELASPLSHSTPGNMLARGEREGPSYHPQENPTFTVLHYSYCHLHLLPTYKAHPHSNPGYILPVPCSLRI
jgi:hypothetical protein